MRTIANEQAARELALYAVNCSDVYRHAMACLENLAKKRARGTYDHSKALVLWGHHATWAAKEYMRIHGSMWDKWYDVFNAATRRLAAQEIAEHYSEQLEEMSK